MNSFGITDKGLLRKENQDSFSVVSNPEGLLAIVCDGIGGANAGEVASKLVVEEMENSFEQYFNKNVDIVNWFNTSVSLANLAVYQKAMEVEQYKGMGTTLVCAVIYDDKCYIANIGDSRCYGLTSDNKLHLITNDHTLYNDLLARGDLDVETLSKFVGKNIISRAVGVTSTVKADIFEVENKELKGLLLCSDGLSSYVKKEDIEEVLKQELTVEDKCQKLVDLANSAGGMDNTTVVIVQR